MPLSEFIPIKDKSLFVHENSIYNNSELFIDDNGNRFFSTPNIKFDHSSNDIFHTITSGEVGRLDLIAQKFYDSAELWWVIAIANDIFNAFTEITIGKILRVPDILAVRREFLL